MDYFQEVLTNPDSTESHYEDQTDLRNKIHCDHLGIVSHSSTSRKPSIVSTENIFRTQREKTLAVTK
jgi:hypothetical protein